MEKKINKNKIWMAVLLLTSLILFAVGIAKLVSDQDYLMASMGAITAVVFSFTVWRISSGKINFDQPNDGLKVFFPIGFIFATVGSSGYLNVGIWGFGLTLFIIGLFFSPKQNEKNKEEENVG